MRDLETVFPLDPIEFGGGDFEVRNIRRDEHRIVIRQLYRVELFSCGFCHFIFTSEEMLIERVRLGLCVLFFLESTPAELFFQSQQEKLTEPLAVLPLGFLPPSSLTFNLVGGELRLRLDGLRRLLWRNKGTLRLSEVGV